MPPTSIEALVETAINELHCSGCFEEANAVAAQAKEIERLREALQGIKWRSADRDNMEFDGRITCFQMDTIRALTKEQPNG